MGTTAFNFCGIDRCDSEGFITCCFKILNKKIIKQLCCNDIPIQEVAIPADLILYDTEVVDALELVSTHVLMKPNGFRIIQKVFKSTQGTGEKLFFVPQ